VAPCFPTITRNALVNLAQTTPGLDLLLLHGSQARGAAHAASDWDFGYLADDRLDVAALLAGLVEILHDDRIDLVNLATSGGLLRYRAARDGVVLFESAPGLGERFKFDAVDFWCDAQPVLQAGYQSVLARL
jgi:predicted nucleotidyltransferase